MLAHVRERNIPTTVCTMYKPNFDNPDQRQMCEPALAALNHAIVTEAIKVCVILRECTSSSLLSSQFGIPVIDLTTVFNEPTDYANAIEPTSEGGAKIVDNIFHVMNSHDFNKPICAIYAKTNK